MQQQYQTFIKPFIQRHQPNEEKQGRCCCPSITPALLARFLLRHAIPILIGLGAGALTEWGERSAGWHNSSALLELSDCISCGMTLVTTYTINTLLNRCWPANPYHQMDFFQTTPPTSTSNHTDGNTIPMQVQHA